MPALTTDPVIRDAIKLRDGLIECAREWRHYVQMHARTDAAKRLGEHDAQISERAAAMLEKLGTEVDRLRQAIGCFGDGRASRSELRHLVNSWNYDAPPGSCGS